MHLPLFQRIREVGAGYTIVGTKWTYNEKNEIATRENLIRLEDYTYKYDTDGNLLSDGRSKYEWNARGQLTKVTFPDGFGEKYTYDMFGRRMTKSQFNHQGSIQDTTVYHYKGDSWVITDEKDGAGNTVLSYTFNEEGRPLSVTYKGETFWYVYNGHGDVTALTDKNGEVAVRYEYDDWGLVNRMYNRYGERVREGIGWIGDLESGNGSPGSLQGPEDGSGNTEPDYHPGIGNAPADGTSATTDTAVTADAFAWLEGEPLAGIQEEPSEDITTELAKVNPYRYAGYYWDRKTQMYFLQARYYDPREARFISADNYRGEGEHPLSLNLYTYALNNPVNFVDPTGHMSWWQIDDLAMGILSSLGDISGLFKYKTLDALWETVKAIAKGKISFKDIARSFVSSVTGPFMYLYNNTKWVWKGDPSNKEVKKYGNQLGTALQMVVGSAGAMKTIIRVVPKLSKLLDKIKPKKNSSSYIKGCNCFTAGTLILTDEGDKPIEEIDIGDKVLSRNEETGELAYKEVTHLYRNDKEITYKLSVGNRIIETTDNHPFWVKGKGWVLATDLEVGDELLQSNGNVLTVKSVEIVKHEELVKVYNFTVADFHTYFVSDLGIWVHNISCVDPNALRRLGSDLLSKMEGPKGGHTIERHVSKTNNELINRANRGDKKGDSGKDASTYPDRSTAAKATLENIRANADSIAKWLNDSNVRDGVTKSFRHNHSYSVGHGVLANTKKVKYGIQKTEIWIKKDSNSEYGFIISTSYPLLR